MDGASLVGRKFALMGTGFNMLAKGDTVTFSGNSKTYHVVAVCRDSHTMTLDVASNDIVLPGVFTIMDDALRQSALHLLQQVEHGMILSSMQAENQFPDAQEGVAGTGGSPMDHREVKADRTAKWASDPLWFMTQGIHRNLQPVGDTQGKLPTLRGTHWSTGVLPRRIVFSPSSPRDPISTSRLLREPGFVGEQRLEREGDPASLARLEREGDPASTSARLERAGDPASTSAQGWANALKDTRILRMWITLWLESFGEWRGTLPSGSDRGECVQLYRLKMIPFARAQSLPSWTWDSMWRTIQPIRPTPENLAESSAEELGENSQNSAGH